MKLDVCIAAYRRKGLEKIASLAHPSMDGVRYVVSWQHAGDSPEDIPESLSRRRDFVIIPNDSKGSGANRKIALDHAEAPLVLMSDDDVSYTASQLQSVMDAFAARPHCDFILGKYHSDAHPRQYPSHEFDFADQPKGFSFGGPVIAVRLKKVRKAGVNFNPLFGVNARFMAGEDTLFVYDMAKKGLKGRFVPIVICGHEDTSTGMRGGHDKNFLIAKGAVMSLIFPFSWPLRLMTHAFRECRGAKDFISYVSSWLKGAIKVRCFS